MQPPRISHGRIVLDLQNFKGGPSLLLGEIPIVIGEAGGHEHRVWMRCGSRDWAGSGGRARSPSAVAEVLAEWLEAYRR